MISKPILEDRIHAAKLLAETLEKELKITKHTFVVSLLRGGYILGEVISQKLKIQHLPLVSAKIRVPFAPEVALGAQCFHQTYLNSGLLKQLLDHYGKEIIPLIKESINQAKNKINKYSQKFDIDPEDYRLKLKGKQVILVDDGIATGATVYAAGLFIKWCNAKEVILASPVAPADFECNPNLEEQLNLNALSLLQTSGNINLQKPQGLRKEHKIFDKCIILIKDPYFRAVGEYYKDFSEVEV